MPWSVLNASSYGVPQDRKRLFLIGAKKGLTVPVYPHPMSFRPDRPAEMGLAAAPTCADALGDLPDADRFATLAKTDEVRTTAYGKPSAYGREMRCEEETAWHFGQRRAWDPAVLTSSTRPSHSEISKTRFSETGPGSVEPISRFFKLSPEGVSNTLSKGHRKGRTVVPFSREQLVETATQLDIVLLQCLDVVLGAMAFRLNDRHREKPEGQRTRGKKTIVKERLYKHILAEIRKVNNVLAFDPKSSTSGISGEAWTMPYRHWKFRPK